MKVVLHIDRLVLRGVAADQRDALIASLSDTLAREFAQPGVAEQVANTGHRAQWRASFVAEPGPRALGQGAARHLAAGVRR